MTLSESGDDRGVTRFHRDLSRPAGSGLGKPVRDAGRGVLECRRAGDFDGWYVGLCSPVPKCPDPSDENTLLSGLNGGHRVNLLMRSCDDNGPDI